MRRPRRPRQRRWPRPRQQPRRLSSQRTPKPSRTKPLSTTKPPTCTNGPTDETTKCTRRLLPARPIGNRIPSHGRTPSNTTATAVLVLKRNRQSANCSRGNRRSGLCRKHYDPFPINGQLKRRRGALLKWQCP